MRKTDFFANGPLFSLLMGLYNPPSSQNLNSKLLACFCDCTGRLSDLVGNTEARFSNIAARLGENQDNYFISFFFSEEALTNKIYKKS